MEEMEDTVKELCMKNDALIKECRKLREINKKLINENAELQNKVTPCSSCCANKNRLVDCTPSNGPAVSITNPLPQGQGVQSATILNRLRTTLVVMNLVMTYLLYQTSSPNSTQTSTLKCLKNSPKVSSKTSPLILKQFLQKEK